MSSLLPLPPGLGSRSYFILFLQKPEHFKKLEWRQSRHKLVRLQAPAVFKKFVKIMIFVIILQDKKLIFFDVVEIEILLRYTKINDLFQFLVRIGSGAEPERSRSQQNLDQKDPESEP